MIGLAPRQCGCNLPAGGGEWRADGGWGWGVKVGVGGIRNRGVIIEVGQSGGSFNNDSTLYANNVCVFNFSGFK